MTDLQNVDGEWILGVLLSVFISYCSHHQSLQLRHFHVSLFVNMFLHLSLFFISLVSLAYAFQFTCCNSFVSSLFRGISLMLSLRNRRVWKYTHSIQMSLDYQLINCLHHGIISKQREAKSLKAIQFNISRFKSLTLGKLYNLTEPPFTFL